MNHKAAECAAIECCPKIINKEGRISIDKHPTKPYWPIHTHTTHNHFTALLEYVRDHPGEQVPER